MVGQDHLNQKLSGIFSYANLPQFFVYRTKQYASTVLTNQSLATPLLRVAIHFARNICFNANLLFMQITCAKH